MILAKLQKRKIIRVEKPDTQTWATRCVNDAMGNAMLVVHELLITFPLRPGDEMTVDVRILIEKKE